MQSQSKPITISILIPVYNVADYVKECLNSILVQIDDNAEIIVMNDASTDNSWEVLQAYQTHPKITLVQAPHNRGLSATRNALLPYAQGEYVWYIDSDDIMHAGAFAQVSEQLHKHPVDVLFGDYIAWRDDYRRQKSGFVGEPNRIYRNEQASFYKDLVKSNSNYAWNKIFKKSVIEQIRFKENLKFEDIYYMADLSKIVGDFLYIKSPLIDYRERQGSIIQTLDKKYVDDYLNAFIYRVDTWYELNPNSLNDKFSNYLWYKTFNRFAGLVKKLDDAAQHDMIVYVNMRYASTFFEYQQQAAARLDWLRCLRSKYEAKKIKQLLMRYCA